MYDHQTSRPYSRCSSLESVPWCPSHLLRFIASQLNFDNTLNRGSRDLYRESNMRCQLKSMTSVMGPFSRSTPSHALLLPLGFLCSCFSPLLLPSSGPHSLCGSFQPALSYGSRVSARICVGLLLARFAGVQSRLRSIS